MASGTWKRIGLAAIALLGMAFTANADRTVVPLEDWKFKYGDYEYGAKFIDDTWWQNVRVPHDWAVKSDFYSYPAIGQAWYRKVVKLPESEAGKRVFAEFDGAMSGAKVYLNEKLVGEWPYGYASFSVDLTENFKFGDDAINVLAVHLDIAPDSSRWYAGAGLYRDVRLVAKAPVHVQYSGTYITTPEVSAKKAVCDIETTVDFSGEKTGGLTLLTEIYNPEGKLVAKDSAPLASADGEPVTLKRRIDVRKPQLWSIETPNMYSAVSKIVKGDKVLDSYTTPFGVRTISWNRDEGFKLNGQRVKFKGVCMHHDLGPIGAAFNVRAAERQLELLKGMGCNAIRTSHNPPAPQFLDLCDKMGFLVMDEVFDEWQKPKCENGYNKIFDEWADRDLEAFVKRDRNHPSVVMWSIGNEIEEQKTGAEGAMLAKRLVDAIHNLDSTRPVTSGVNLADDALKSGYVEALDIAGFNYKPWQYKQYYDAYPNMIILGSETVSTVSSRGSFKFPVQENRNPWYDDYQVSDYNMDCTPWSDTPDVEFANQDDNPFVLGEFVWTGFDYIGEPFPYMDGKARSAYFGIFDLGGLKKERYYLYKSQWDENEKVLHLLPHWNWPDRVGQNVPVHCFTNYDRVELFVNGESAGIRQKSKDDRYTRYRMKWDDVVYNPGEIKAVAYDADGNVVAETTVKTAGEPAGIKLIPDRQTINADGKDLCFVEVQIVDKDGNVCPRADNLIRFKTEGNGNVRGICNGNPADYTPYTAQAWRAFNGKLMVVVESPSGKGGDIKLNAISDFILPAETVITVK